VKDLLRSTFRDGPGDDATLFLRNAQALRDSGLGFDIPEDGVLWTYVKDFIANHHHVPDASTIRGHFERVGQVSVLDRLDIVCVEKPRTQGDFLQLLDSRIEDRRIRVVSELLSEAARIVDTGITVKEGREERILKGPAHAVRYVLDRSHEVITPVTGVRLSGDVTSDGESFVKEYERVETDPLAGIGQFVGIKQMDEMLKGAKRGELWTHAAFTGGLKSTLALNWHYNQAVYYRHSSILFSLEMPYQQVRRILYAMHSAHEKFAEVRKSLGIGKSIDYSQIRDGELPPEHKKFLLDHVVPDFNDPANRYGHIHIEVADPDKSDFTVNDLRTRSELLYQKDPAIQMITVDHAGLMQSRNRYSGTTERLNEVIRDLKRLAMSFNRGAGIAVITLFQISREGFKSAEKSGGRYNLTHLSYANECIPSDVLLPTRRGNVRMDEVRVGDEVWSRSGWKPVRHVFDQGVKRLWEITTDRGATLETTGSHRVRVLNGSDIGWKATQDLVPGDWLVSTTGDYPWPDTPPEIPPMDVRPYEKARGEQGVPLVTPGRMTEGLAYLLGAWDGDGHVHSRGVAFTGNRDEVAVKGRIRNLFLDTFGHPLGMQESPSRPGSFDLVKWSQPLKRWFEAVAGDRAKGIPPAVTRSPKACVLAYLRGLFDTDGWINNQNVVGIKMESEAMLRQVQYVMGLLGYDTHLSMTPTTLASTGKTYEGWTLRLRGFDSRKKFADEIGFTEPWKMARLTASVAQHPSRAKDARTYPVADAFVALCDEHTPHSLCTAGVLRRSHFNTIAKARRTGLVPHGALTYLLDYLDNAGVRDPMVKRLRDLTRLRITRVVSVKDTGREEQVWDIEVDGDHEYQSGPLLSHNCERSSDIVTAGWVDTELRESNLVKFQCLKSRDNAPFADFYSGVLWPCRRIYTTSDVTAQQAKKVGDDIDLGV